jgi:basic membrane protein A
MDDLKEIMSMKKISRRSFMAVAGAAAVASVLTACGGSSSASSGSSAAAESTGSLTSVALCCDTGTIDDESFNQACWTAVQSYMGDNCQYYIPNSDASDSDRETLIRQAVNDGAQAIVCVGYLYGASLAWAAEQYPDINFIAVDVTQGDIGTDAIPANCYCITFKEEQAGYLAGYAVTKDGFTKQGFLGGMAVPAVIRYGYGYVQGADAAAQELGVNVEINYFYGGQFYGDANITSRMEGWYGNGTEIVFACGGGIYTSALEAAVKNNG